MSYAEKYEESFACVRLFSEGDAQAERAVDIAQVEHIIEGLQAAMEQVNDNKGEIKLAQMNRDKDFTRSNETVKRMRPKSRVGCGTESVAPQIGKCANLAQELLLARTRLSLVRPVQVFGAVVSVQNEQPQFHMPSQQVKHSRPVSNETNKALEKPKPAAEGAGENKPAPVVCFYVRPEHKPNAKYTAISLAKQDFPSLLSAISSKLHAPISTVGTIYFYDQQMTRVVVNEKSIRSLPHEQDLIVQLPWVASHLPVFSEEENLQVPYMGDVSDFSACLSLDETNINQSEHAIDGNLVFGQYLTLPFKGPFGASADQWSEVADDASMPMNQTIAQYSSAKSTVLSDDGLHYEEDHFQHQLISGEPSIDNASYASDATPGIEIPMMCLYSTPTQDNLQLSTSIWKSQQLLAPPPKILHLSAVEGASLKDSANPSDKELAVIKPLQPGYMPPVVRKYVKKQSSRLKDKTHPPRTCNSTYNDIPKQGSDIPKQGVANRDVRARERNKISAAKCRFSRKEKEARLQQLFGEQSQLNIGLKLEISLLEAQVAEIRGFLQAHVNCIMESGLACKGWLIPG